MLIKELVQGVKYSQGRGSKQYKVLDAHIWHSRWSPNGTVFAPGRNPYKGYHDGWGVPCLVYDREGNDPGQYTVEKPLLVSPRKFVGTWDQVEAEQKAIDDANAERKRIRDAESAAFKADATAIGDVLTNLGVTGHTVRAGQYDYHAAIHIPEPALASMLIALTESAKVAEGMAQDLVAKYKEEVDEKANAVIDANNLVLEQKLADNKQVILDLLYELDVTWDEWFSGQEVVVSA